MNKKFSKKFVDSQIEELLIEAFSTLNNAPFSKLVELYENENDRVFLKKTYKGYDLLEAGSLVYARLEILDKYRSLKLGQKFNLSKLLDKMSPCDIINIQMGLIKRKNRTQKELSAKDNPLSIEKKEGQYLLFKMASKERCWISISYAYMLLDAANALHFDEDLRV